MLTDDEGKMILDFYRDNHFFFWWDNPDFQRQLILSYLMESGKDYIFHGNQVYPVSQTTGYPEKGKQYEGMINIFLYLKDKILTDEKQDLSLAYLINQMDKELKLVIEEEDRWLIIFYYLSLLKKGKIFGFTGTIGETEDRLYQVYQLESTFINPHFETKQNIYWHFCVDFDQKMVQLLEQIKTTKNNTLIVVNSEKEAKKVIEFLQTSVAPGLLDYRLLSPKNEEDDFNFYQWVSQKGEQRRILICIKMVGRGVDLRPDDEIKEEGFLLLSTAAFKYYRSNQQLIGRVGRRGEFGEVHFFISPEDEAFSYLEDKRRKNLKKVFRDQKREEIERLLNESWDFWEKEITEKMKYWGLFFSPIEVLREWLKGAIDLVGMEKKMRQEFNLDSQEVKKLLKKNWNELLTFLESTFQAELSSPPLTGFHFDLNYWRSRVYQQIEQFIADKKS